MKKTGETLSAAEIERRQQAGLRRAKVRKAATTALAALAAAALFVIVVFTCFEWVAFDEGRHQRLQQNLGIEAVTGMSETDLGRVTHELLQYCRGARKDLNMQAVIHGETREVFGQREKEHMVDVQRLFVSGLKIRTVLIIGFLFLLLVLIYVARKRFMRELARGWIIAVSVLGALLAALGVWFALDFQNAFTQFHLLFFTNDLWLLDPAHEVLIQMVPGEFFFSTIQAIVLTSAAALLALTAAAVVLLRARRRSAKPTGVEQA